MFQLSKYKIKLWDNNQFKRKFNQLKTYGANLKGFQKRFKKFSIFYEYPKQREEIYNPTELVDKTPELLTFSSTLVNQEEKQKIASLIKESKIQQLI